jgi:Xaa-Pro aminopeptidase
MAALLLYGDTERTPSMRHEVPIGISDPFLLAEQDGKTWIMSWGLEAPRMAACRPDAELLELEALGLHEVLASGMSWIEADLELVSRVVAATGVTDAFVDFDFPLAIAERLRADGVSLRVDAQAVSERRRRKSAPELAGIRRAQVAAERAIGAASAMLARAQVQGDALTFEGKPLLAEQVRAEMRDAAWAAGAILPPEVIVASAWQGHGHEPGSGPLPAGLPIQIDVWPRDTASQCWADMTRTFVVGAEPPAEIRRQEELVLEALADARASVRPGVRGRELHDRCCDLFERAGYPTQRTAAEDPTDEGFQFSLGHGVGLQIHEAPALGRAGVEPLVAGDVVAVEPGLWRPGVGGVRFEDLLLVTVDGCELLTDFPYEMAVGG